MSSDSLAFDQYRDVLSPPPRLGLVGAIDGYDVVATVGAGGMGLVFHALAPNTGTAVAIKTMRPHLAANPEAVRRFVREGKHMRQLVHPHIVPVLEVSEGPRVPYFVMPIMSGGSLQQRIDDRGPIPAEDAVAIAIQVGEALAHAHRHAVFHRDLKPSNVLLNQSGDAYLADFGLLRRFFDESMVEPGPASRAGTPAYMSPKTAAGEPETTGGDIYAFGAMLYEMLSGRTPYTGDSSEEVIRQVAAGPPKPLAQVKPGLPDALVTIVEGAMARELRDRYAEMGDVVADLRRVESGERTLGPYRQSARRRPRRRWVFVAAGGLVAICAVAGIMLWPSAPYKLIPGPTLIQGVEGVRLQKGVVKDADGDGIPELAVPVGGNIRVYSLLDGSYQDIVLGVSDWKAIEIRDAIDLNASPDAEYIVTIEGERESQLIEVSSDRGVISRYTYPSTPFTTDDGHTQYTAVKYRGMTDLEGDGSMELFVAHDDGHARVHRGIACYDLITTAERWSFAIAPATAGTVFMDLDADGIQDLVIGTNSHATDFAVNGTQDDIAYLIGLSSSGERLWSPDVNQIYKEPYPRHDGIEQHYLETVPMLLDLDDDGEDELTVMVLTEVARRPGIGALFRISPATGLPMGDRSYNLNTAIIDHHVIDLDGDGKKELLISDANGRIHILDHELDLKDDRPPIEFAPPRFKEGDSMIRFCGEVQAGNGETLLVVSAIQVHHLDIPESGAEPCIKQAYDIRVMMVNMQFDVLATHDIAEVWDIDDNPGLAVHVVDADRDGEQELLVLTDRGYLLEVEVSGD